MENFLLMTTELSWFIDHVTIWDRALTTDEIKKSMLPSLTLAEEGLLGLGF